MSYQTNDIIHQVNDPAIRYGKSQNGISKSDLIAIVALTGLTLTEFSKLLPASKRTIEKVKDQELLTPNVSDRALQIAALFQHGTEMFGDIDLFKSWLNSELLALANLKPYDLLSSGTGIAIVHDLLGRIEHGVYS